MATAETDLWADRVLCALGALESMKIDANDTTLRVGHYLTFRIHLLGSGRGDKPTARSGGACPDRWGRPCQVPLIPGTGRFVVVRDNPGMARRTAPRRLHRRSLDGLCRRQSRATKGSQLQPVIDATDPTCLS